jgi:hypothetical protein
MKTAMLKLKKFNCRKSRMRWPSHDRITRIKKSSNDQIPGFERTPIGPALPIRPPVSGLIVFPFKFE